MTFKTNKQWELKGLFELSPSGERNYPLFEASLFGNYYILDSQESEVDEDGETSDFKRRFFISNLITALKLIGSLDNKGIKHESITLLQGSNWTETEDYNASVIEKITYCNDDAGQDAWLFALKNGTVVVESLLTKNESELVKVDVLYVDSALTRYGHRYLDSIPTY